VRLPRQELLGGDRALVTPTNTPNKKGNFRGVTPAQREALARGRMMRHSKKGGHIRSRQVAGLQGEASLAIANRLRRFVEAYNDDPEVLSQVAIGQLLADLWDANSFLRPIWITVRRLVTRINHADRKNGTNGTSLEEDLKTLESLDGLVPVLDQLGRWHKRTTDVALRLGELSVRLRTAGGGNYLEDRYGAGAPGRDEAPEIPPDAADAEVLEEEAEGPGESAHGATSPAEPEAPPDAD